MLERMLEKDADAILEAWQNLTDHGPRALRLFLVEALPQVEAWALRYVRGASRDPDVLAVTTDHLYGVEATTEDDHGAFSLKRWRLDGPR